MKEIINANGMNYECSSVETTTNSISFTTEGNADELKELLKDVKEITVSDEEGVVYGEYSNLALQSVTTNILDESENVTITFRIKSDMEIRIEALEESQNDQDETIAEIIFGGE